MCKYSIFNQLNVKDFPIQRFHKNWPFSMDLAKDLFNSTLYYQVDSLKNFFILKAFETAESTFLDEENYSWYHFDHLGFYINNDKIYYVEFHDTLGTFEHISYDIIVCECFRHVLNDSLKAQESYAIWMIVLRYLLKKDFSILGILKNENYIKDHKENILQGFYYGFKALDQGKAQSESLKSLFKGKEKPTSFNSKINLSQKKLSNIFLYCEISTIDSKTLAEDFFVKESYKTIVLYYQNMIFDLFHINMKKFER